MPAPNQHPIKSWECNWININIGKEKENSMFLMNFYIPDLHHIGSEPCGSPSVFISVACPQKASLSPVKHCLPCLIQTKPTKIPDWKDKVICFSVLLIFPFCFLFSFFRTSPPSFCLYQTQRGVSRQSEYILSSFPKFFLCLWGFLRVLPTAQPAAG